MCFNVTDAGIVSQLWVSRLRADHQAVMCFMCLVVLHKSNVIFYYHLFMMMINEKSAIDCLIVQDNVFTYVLGFNGGEKQRLMQKNSLLAGTSYQIKLGTVVVRTSGRASSRYRTPGAETRQCFADGCWFGLAANICRVKDGSDRRTSHPQFETFIFFHLCLLRLSLFCALSWSACFMHVFSLLELLTVAVQYMFLDRVGVTRVWYACGGDPNGHGIASADWQRRTIKAIIEPLFKETRCMIFFFFFASIYFTRMAR